MSPPRAGLCVLPPPQAALPSRRLTPAAPQRASRPFPRYSHMKIRSSPQKKINICLRRLARDVCRPGTPSGPGSLLRDPSGDAPVRPSGHPRRRASDPRFPWLLAGNGFFFFPFARCSRRTRPRRPAKRTSRARRRGRPRAHVSLARAARPPTPVLSSRSRSPSSLRPRQKRGRFGWPLRRPISLLSAAVQVRRGQQIMFRRLTAQMRVGA